ncbi:MAG: carboxypeptidase regulatory-like domain-containing protein [Aridibacter famidurans]|nr:carboxypeptidase regulatory-like domain-containing protein [Aridibacter famidurans]
MDKLRIRIVPVVLALIVGSGIAPAQRAIVNPSFEQPVIPANNYRQINEDNIDGWETSHPQNSSCTVGTNPCRPIEYWRQVFNGVSAATGAGLQWAEINSTTNSMIYQPQCVISGESFSYAFLHRGRASSSVADVMQFRLGIPGGLPSGSVPADSYSYPIVQVATTNNGTVGAPPVGSGTINAPVAAGNGWRRYSGTYTYTGPSQVVNMGFVALSTGGGDLSIGNFVDGWTVTLVPFYEFNAAAGNDYEDTIFGGGSSTPANRPRVRVYGTVASPLAIRVSVTGGTATLGEDYSLTATFQSGSSVSFVDIVVPAGVYDGTTTGVYPVPFAVSTDNEPELDETVDFAFALLGGSATASSIDSCGSAAISSTTYTIENDDLVTAGDSEVSGRVVDSDGRPIYGVQLYLVSIDGEYSTARSNQMGRFRFAGIEAGSDYYLSAFSRSHVFLPRVITVNESIDGLVIQSEAASSRSGLKLR